MQQRRALSRVQLFANPIDYSPPGSSVHGDSPSKNTRVGCHALLQRIFPTQGWNPGLPQYRQILNPSEPPGKPKNTGVGSLFLLQWIFLTQESNKGLLHCRRILYQLSYPGRPQTLQINVRTLALTLTDKRSHWTALSRGVMLFDLHLNTISLTDKS